MKSDNPKLILDIRYFESNIPNIIGSSLPTYVGTLFNFPRSCTQYGVRIARKLREVGFQCGAFDHMYLNFTTAVPEKAIDFSPRAVHKEDSWLRYVDYGLSPQKLNEMSDTLKTKVLVDSTFDALCFIASSRPDMLARVKEVFSSMNLHGERLEILHKRKETDHYSISVLYEIHGPGLASTVFLEFYNKRSGEARKGSFLELGQYEDLFFLVSDISFKDECIILKPRRSFKADLSNKQYKTPIFIAVEELKVVLK